jgi:hypothetical protein
MTRNFLLATALSLAIAFGGLVWFDGGNAQASSYEGTAMNAAPVTDQEACSTTGWYNAGFYSPGETIYVASYGGVAVPYGMPLYGAFGFWPGWSYPTLTAVSLPATPWLPNESQAYTQGTINNYACNAFANCIPVANSNATVCPGNPAGITLNSSLTSSTCGSAMNIDARVVGPSGLPVADGTPVLFTTTLGMVPAATTTSDGIASVSLVFAPKTTGTATFAVAAGMAKTEAKITVTC